MAKRKAPGRHARGAAGGGARRTDRSARGPFGRIDERALGGLAERLRGAGYDEAAAARRLGTGHLAGLSRERIPLYRARLAGGDALDAAIAFFLLGDELPAGALAPLFGDDGGELLERLVDCGLVAVSGRGRAAQVRSTVAVFPCAGALIATDPRFPRSGARRASDADARPARDAVMYLGGDSYALAYLAPRRTVGAALDLCTGSGVHAILAARHAERVVAVDISARAIAFGHLNAALNDLAGRIDWRRGDLYAPLAEGDRFDLVLANPPFVPSPHEGRARLLYRDGGRDGSEILARIITGLHGRLEREGVATIVSVFAERADETLRSWVERRLPRGAELSGIFARLGDDGPLDYAFSQTRRPYGDTPEEHDRRFGRWVATLDRARLRRLAGGVLALKPHTAPSAPWWRTIDAPPPLAPDPQGLERLLKYCEAALGAVFAEELLDRRAAAAPDIVFVDELRRPTVEEIRRLIGGEEEEEHPSEGGGEGAGEQEAGSGEAKGAGARDRPHEGKGGAAEGQGRRAGEGAAGGPSGKAGEGDSEGGAGKGEAGRGEGAKDAGDPPRAERGEGDSEGLGADDAPSSEDAPSLVPQRHRVRAGTALGSEVGLSGELRALLERADGTRTLRAVIAGMAAEVETDAKHLEERVLGDALELAARGFLLLDKV